MALIGPILQSKGTGLYAFTTHTFTNASAVGPNGPTLAQCRTAYSATTWAANTSFFNMTIQGYQLWTVPRTASYTITCAGARGGLGSLNLSGQGVLIRTTVSLTSGTILAILCGQQGIDRLGGCNGTDMGGGGGGSFVYNTTSATWIIVAGGGGGGGTNSNTTNTNGSLSTSGNTAPGTNGGLGSSGGSTGGNGTGCVTNAGLGGRGNNSYAGGGLVGVTSTVSGGFGGGGGVSQYGGGGGGGYSGGGGGGLPTCSCNDLGAGGGGGSFPTGATNLGTNNGMGYVTITAV